jgi:hypothetical protein
MIFTNRKARLLYQMSDLINSQSFVVKLRMSHSLHELPRNTWFEPTIAARVNPRANCHDSFSGNHAIFIAR